MPKEYLEKLTKDFGGFVLNDLEREAGGIMKEWIRPGFIFNEENGSLLFSVYGVYYECKFYKNVYGQKEFSVVASSSIEGKSIELEEAKLKEWDLYNSTYIRYREIKLDGSQVVAKCGLNRLSSENDSYPEVFKFMIRDLIRAAVLIDDVS